MNPQSNNNDDTGSGKVAFFTGVKADVAHGGAQNINDDTGSGKVTFFTGVKATVAHGGAPIYQQIYDEAMEVALKADVAHGGAPIYQQMIMERKFQPVISFSFSRRECEQHAMSLSKLDFNTIEEKAILCLNKEDRNLPAIEEKALFATETFAMGLHMPAKTVVFTNVKKWDGDSNRYIGSGEYVQMSGRAGRRGKDERGICIIMIDEQLQKFRNELKNRSRVLKKLGHIDADGVVQLNRRAAFLIDTGDELLVTESMLNGTFNDLDHHQVVALASCFIPGDRSNEQIHLRTELAKPLQQLQECARRIAEVQHKCNLEIIVDEYVESTARPYLMDVMYCWSKDSIESIDMVSKVEELEHRLSSHPLHKVQLFIKSLTGKTITVEFGGGPTQLLDLKFYEKLGIPSQEQRLVYRWKQLIDANTLVDYQAHSQSTIHLCLKLKGGMRSSLEEGNRRTEIEIPNLYEKVRLIGVCVAVIIGVVLLLLCLEVFSPNLESRNSFFTNRIDLCICGYIYELCK